MLLFISPDEKYFTKRFLEEAKKALFPVEQMAIRELATRNFRVDVGKYSALYVRFCYPYFKETVALAQQFIRTGKKVVDAVIANGDADIDKMRNYELLQKADIKIPKTHWLKSTSPFPPGLFPLVLKLNYSFGGKGTFLVKTNEEINQISQKHPAEDLLAQEYIEAEYEYKVVCVGYKALPVVLRVKVQGSRFKSDFENYQVLRIHTTPSASGVHPSLAGGEAPRESSDVPRSSPPFQGGVPPSGGEVVGDSHLIKKVIQLAEQSSRILNRELSKVDILQKGNELFVLEVNRWPGLQMFEKLTGYNVVFKFLDYIAKK